MADTQPAPAPDVTDVNLTDGGIEAATEAILGLLKPETETSETEEAAPEETEEVSEESEEEPLEASADEPEEESEEPDESEEQEEELLYAVKVDGEDREVTLDELMNGYSRQSSFTKKSQALSEQRKEFETAQQQMAAEYQQIQTERQQYVDSLQQVIEGSVANLGQYQSVDWERLKMEDPLEYVTKRE